MNNPLTLLPAVARKWLYVAYGLAGLVVACVDVFYGDADPSWVQPSQDVLAYLVVPMGVLAASNTPASPAEVADAVQDQLAGDDPEDPAVNDGLPVEEPVDQEDVFPRE